MSGESTQRPARKILCGTRFVAVAIGVDSPDGWRPRARSLDPPHSSHGAPQVPTMDHRSRQADAERARRERGLPGATTGGRDGGETARCTGFAVPAGRGRHRTDQGRMNDGGAGPNAGGAAPAPPAALETYLGGVDPAATPLVLALDGVIREAHPDFDVAVKYRILMYALHGDWRTWVCAIDAGRKSVGLRFLYGVLLDDPLRVLRAGSSVLETWDFAFDQVVDRAAVGAYVREAVARYDDYKANTREILEASRAAATTKRRRFGNSPKPGS